MATTADFKNGLYIVFNGDFYTIVEFQHVKPGKGGAFVRTKLKNLRTGRVIENTFTAGVKIDLANIERRLINTYTTTIAVIISCTPKHSNKYLFRKS